MLTNNGCQLVASRYSAMPIILLAVIHNRSSSEANWLVQKVVGILVRQCRIQSFSILIVRSTCPLG